MSGKSFCKMYVTHSHNRFFTFFMLIFLQKAQNLMWQSVLFHTKEFNGLLLTGIALRF